MDRKQTENLLDSTTLLAACGGDSHLLQKMIDSFQLRAPEQLADLSNAAQRQDKAKFCHSAHKLRGLVATFSTSIATTIGALERLAVDQHADHSMSECAIAIELVEALSRILSSLSIEDLGRLSAIPAGDAST